MGRPPDREDRTRSVGQDLIQLSTIGLICDISFLSPAELFGGLGGAPVLVASKKMSSITWFLFRLVFTGKTGVTWNLKVQHKDTYVWNMRVASGKLPTNLESLVLQDWILF